MNLFNKFGSKDVYDEHGLPDIKKAYGYRPSRTEYVKFRLHELNGKPEMRELLTEICNAFENKEIAVDAVNELEMKNQRIQLPKFAVHYE